MSRAAMRNTLWLSAALALLAAGPARAQLSFTNDGAQVVFGPGAVVGVVGDFNNRSGVVNALSGSTVFLYGNFASAPAATLGAGTGQWRLQGAGPQTVDTNGGSLPTLLLNNGGGASLLSSLGTSALTLQAGYFYLNASDLRVGSTLAGANGASRFIVTNGAGFLRRPTAAGTFFPIGSAPGSYNPATLSAPGSPDFGARVADRVHLQNGGLSGTTQATNVVDRHWQLTGYGGPAVPLSVELQWATAHEAPAFDRGQSAVGYFTGQPPRQYHQPPFAQFDAATPVGTAAPIDTFRQQATYTTAGDVFIVGDRQSPLPVTLVLFEAQRLSPSRAGLRWRTALEAHNAGFEVWRAEAAAPTDFRRVGRVAPSGRGSGDYRFEDPNRAPGLTYYRLRQVDDDSTATFSPVRVVAGAAAPAKPEIVLFPNPATHRATLDLSQLPAGSYETTWFDITGRPGARARYAAGQHHHLDLRPLPAGAYVLRVRGEAGFVRHLRVIVQ